MARIILLTEPELSDAVAAPIAAAARDVVLALAPTLAALDGLLADGASETRLLSVGAKFIVPARILKALPGPAYNLHPGPPDYPGIFPSVFALYERASRFGVTLHEMAAKVDSGPIVAVDAFDIAPGSDRLTLDRQTFAVMLAMIARFAAALADARRPLPRGDAAWSGRTRTHKDFDALCHLPEDADAAEFGHRLRAIGEGPDHALTFTRFGRIFRLASENQTGVVRGGQRVKA